MVSCSPHRTVQRYSYLYKNAPAPSKVEEESKSSTESKQAAVKPAPPKHTPIRPATPATPASTDAIKVVRTAKSYLGTPYRYGGTSRTGIDCSGLMYMSFKAINKTLPRSSYDIAELGRNIPLSRLQVGDLVAFSSSNGKRVDHVGLITCIKGGEIYFIHATTSKGVIIDRLDEGYWKNRLRKTVRAV